MNKYHINVFYSEEDEGYISDIPDLECCSAFGETPEKAVTEFLIAQKLWLDVAKDKNMEIPKPKYNPVHRELAV